MNFLSLVSTRRVAGAMLAAAVALASTGCAVVTVVGTAASLATDVAVGAVKITGKAIGTAVDAVTPDSK
jgi:outer membrane receptor protein involved in Fe transport